MSGKRHQDTWERRDEAEQKVEELEQENAELREKVERLEGALASFENWLEVTATYAVSKPKRDYAEFTLKTLRVALSQAKPENQEE